VKYVSSIALNLYMSKKQKIVRDQTLDDYVFINSQNYSIEKKPSAMIFFLTELSVYLLISLASYFSFYLGTHQFSNEQALIDNIDLLTRYFSNSNLENSLLGICIVIGLVSSLNYIVTNS